MITSKKGFQLQKYSTRLYLFEYGARLAVVPQRTDALRRRAAHVTHHVKDLRLQAGCRDLAPWYRPFLTPRVQVCGTGRSRSISGLNMGIELLIYIHVCNYVGRVLVGHEQAAPKNYDTVIMDTSKPIIFIYSFASAYLVTTSTQDERRAGSQVRAWK